MIRVGIVGCNFGHSVHLPAFRIDRRCEVVALAGANVARVEMLARDSGIEAAFGDWSALVEDERVDAVTIATPPALQPTIALRALALNKPVFVEKPLAVDLETAAKLLEQAASTRQPTIIDFEFPEITAWRRAKALLVQGAIGKLRHVVVTWNVENAVTRLRLKNWKSSRDAGGGVLGNFVCHCLYYLEWFCGPFQRLSARMFELPGRAAHEETTAVLTFDFRSGAAASLTVSCASYAGSGHRLEFYGEDGALMLINEESDYIRGFRLVHAKRPNNRTPIPVDDPLENVHADGRIAPVARLAARFIDTIEGGKVAEPTLTHGYRVQQLMAAARRSHDLGTWVDVEAEVSK